MLYIAPLPALEPPVQEATTHLLKAVLPQLVAVPLEVALFIPLFSAEPVQAAVEPLDHATVTQTAFCHFL